MPTLSARASRSRRVIEGRRLPVSIRAIVFRAQPIRVASCCCVQPRSFRRRWSVAPDHRRLVGMFLDTQLVALCQGPFPLACDRTEIGCSL